MPSPFPGMNPYLEAPNLWPGFHNSYIAAIRNAINRTAPGKYFADIEERVFLVTPDDPAARLIVPDVSIRDSSITEFSNESTGTLTATPSITVAMLEESMSESYITVRADNFDEVVSIIEVLSPANKTNQSASQRSYLAKRKQVLLSRTHFIEIDLLRAGMRSPMAQAEISREYLISLSRRERRPLVDCWVVGLLEPLPTIPVPLLPGDDDVLLDLQQLLHTVHDESGYVRRLNYNDKIPQPELAAELLAAVEVLGRKG